ncbi:MAG: hypothetical protein KGV59_01750 [Tenacibaculum sp.]|nr:hypothetical protein [Tenacibaculum sp.]
MKKLFLVLVASLLAFTSCSKDDGNNNPEKEKIKRKLQKIIRTSNSGTETTILTYGGNGFVEKIDINEVVKPDKMFDEEGYEYNTTVRFNYNSKNYINKYEYFVKENDEDDFSGSALVNYDDKGRITSIKDNDSEGTDIRIYKYDKKGLLVEVKYEGTYEDEGKEKNHAYTTTYEYDVEGNVSKKVIKYDDRELSSDDVATYTYDNKINPTNSVFPNNFKLGSLGEGIILENFLSNNNIISKMNGRGTVTNYKYTYVDDLPETVTYEYYGTINGVKKVTEKVTETLFYNN